MTSLLETLPSVALEPVRSFMTEYPELRAALHQAEGWLAPAISGLDRELPLPPSAATFVAQPFYRPPGSHRCFYYCPASVEGKVAARGRAVLAFKGLEPCVDDLDATLQSFRRACYSPHNIAEHLIFEEQKIPGCLGAAEALREAQRAADIQREHLRTYGCLARLPLPLFVFRHSEATAASVLAKLGENLSEAALRAVEPWVSAGLGAYVYYYPSAPVRARDVDTLLQGQDFRQRLFTLMGICDPEEVVQRWVRGFVRLLYLGMLPGSLASLRTGVCCQVQNACLDGGFVDLDSLTPLESLRDDTAVYAALEFSTTALLGSVRALVAGSADPTRPEGADVRVDLHHLRQYLHSLLLDALASEVRPGLALDERVRRFFVPSRSFAELAARLGTYYSVPNPTFVRELHDYQEFGMWLLSVARDA